MTASVYVNLSARGDSFEARYDLADLPLIPDDARLILFVGKVLVGWEAARLLRVHVDRIHIEIQGDPLAVRTWLEALRDGEMAGMPL